MEVPRAAAAAREMIGQREERTMVMRSLCLALACAVSWVLPASAHHSHNNYDVAKWTTMEGTVTEVHRLVPHSWIYIDVTDAKGQTTPWALEGTGPGGLERVGIKINDVRPGDRIKVRCHLLKDGSNGCLLGFVTPMHGDVARGHGVEKDWDGGGGAGLPATGPYADPAAAR
jgi:Family of unknown function (DUF6152)